MLCRGRRVAQGEGEPEEVRGAGRLEQVEQVADRSCVTGRKDTKVISLNKRAENTVEAIVATIYVGHVPRLVVIIIWQQAAPPPRTGEPGQVVVGQGRE